ncbi:glycosyltransferase family 4 protein [Chromobacterium violaceum]|uniref:glycosyltransferase family 4 protein n=1 Tax=Chromobacterium violaceum TaxID=536 RepID=UPI001CE0E5B9|nr:glycosyltransferase family 1 protein [Chromobacterium violaceum]
MQIKVVSGIERSTLRVLYEQCVMPFLVRDYDIVYSINNVNPLLPLGRIKSIVTIHDLLPFKTGARYGKLQGAYLRLLTKFCARRAEKIVTVSEFTKNEISKFLGVSASKVSVFYNCLPHSFCEARNDSKQFLLIVAGLNADKRVDCALRGFKEYLQRNPSSRLRLMIAGGDQGARCQLEELTADIGLQERVHFLGEITDEEKNELLSDCVAIVMMGRSEGFGIPVLEAMRVGKPALVAKAGALPEVMGKAGVMVRFPESADQVAEGIQEIVESNIDWFSVCRSEYKRFDILNTSLAFWSSIFSQ